MFCFFEEERGGRRIERIERGLKRKKDLIASRFLRYVSPRFRIIRRDTISLAEIRDTIYVCRLESELLKARRTRSKGINL